MLLQRDWHKVRVARTCPLAFGIVLTKNWNTELEIPMDEALSVVRQYNQGELNQIDVKFAFGGPETRFGASTDPIPTTSALDLLERDLRRRPITTFCSALDSLLDSKAAGVPVGVVTEFCGEPGVGKTQIAWVSFPNLLSVSY
jgi:hypothetical protein